MLLSRAPLTEISSSQVNNPRKLAARQQTYGKHRRLATVQASIWEFPVNEDKRIENSKQPANDSPSPDLHDQLANRLEDLAIASHDASAKPVLEKVGSDDTTIFQKPALGKLDSENRPIPAKLEPSSNPLARRDSRRARTATHKSVTLPFELDVTALLRESHAYTKKNLAEIKSFSEFADKLNKQFAIKKHADGSFGDVYKLFAHSSTKSSSKNRLERLGGGVLKIIPLCGKTGPGARKFSRVEDVLSEVRVLRRLDALHGFTRFRDVHVVQGRYPASFAKAFHDYNNEVRESETAPPERFNARQLFAILDMDDAGNDLECLLEPNIFQIHDIFWACAIVLAYGEATVEFEARDMHIGNICIRPFIRNGQMDVLEHHVSEWSEDQVRHLGLTGIRVTLIDYTLSRAKLQDGTVAFMDLKNKKFLFPPASKDPATLQQRAYYQMRDVVRAASGGKTEDWSRFVPRTNIVWLAYLVEKLLGCQAIEVVEESNEYCAEAQSAMREKLRNVLQVLKVSTGEEGGGGVNSAGELLQLALERLWLNKSEVEWYTQQLESEV